MAEIEIARELLCNCAGTLLEPQRDDILHHRLDEPDGVDTPVTVEILVLGGNQRLYHTLRDVLKTDVGSVFYEKLIEYFAVKRVHLCREFRFGILNTLERREAGEKIHRIEEKENGRDSQHRCPSSGVLVRPFRGH